MFEPNLKRMREKIRTRQYVMTLHAEEEMAEDGYSVFDVESGILSGAIFARQKEPATAEWKYLLKGQAVAGDAIIVVAKLSPTGKLVIITVYRP